MRPSNIKFRRLCEILVVSLILQVFAAFWTSNSRAALTTSSNNCNTQYFPQESKWIPVRSPSGGSITDPTSDVQGSGNLTNVDIYGTDATETSAAGSAVDWYSTGSAGCFMFRMRVYASATNSAGDNIDQYMWILGLGTGSTANGWMVVNGDPNGGQVETYQGNFSDGKKYVFTTAVGSDSSTAWVNTVSGRHYVYWKVP